jgi:L-lactate permease
LRKRLDPDSGLALIALGRGGSGGENGMSDEVKDVLAHKEDVTRRDGFKGFLPFLAWSPSSSPGPALASNAVFGSFQATVGKLLHAPALIFPSLNSVGAEVGKPVAPQTASVGVSTTKFVRNEGQVIRHNMPWTLVILAYLIGVGALYYFVLPSAMKP